MQFVKTGKELELSPFAPQYPPPPEFPDIVQFVNVGEELTQ